MKELRFVPDEDLQALTYEDYGQTLYLDANTASNLLELKRLLGSPTLEAAARIAIERQVIQQGGRMLETRPLVSLGQGEYRRDIMEGDV